MKRILRALSILALVLAAVSFAVSIFFDADSFRPLLESRLTATLGRDVKFGHLKLSILSRRVVADQLSIAEDPAFGANPFLRAKSVHLRVNLPALVFSQRLSITAVKIDQPSVTLLQNTAGKWNFSSLGARASSAHPNPTSDATGSAKGGLELSTERITIEDGKLSVGQKPYVLEKMSLSVENFALASAFPFTLSAQVFGGAFHAQGKAGPIVTTDAAATPVDATFDATGVDLAKAPTDLGGLVSLNGSVNLSGHTVHLKAHGKADKLKLVAGGSAAGHPVEVDSVVDHDLTRQTGILTQGDVRAGKAVVRISGSYSFPGTTSQMQVKLSVSGQDMPLADLVGLMPAVNVGLPSGTSIRGGRVSVRMTVEGVVDQVVSVGAVSAAGVSLTGYDLGSKLASLERLAGIRTGPTTEIQQFSTGVQTGPQGTRLENVKVFVTGIGQISGAGTINTRHQLDFKMHANLISPEANLINLARGVSSGVPFTITGTSSNPVFKADVRGIVSQELGASAPGGRGVPSVATDLLKGLLGGRKQKQK